MPIHPIIYICRFNQEIKSEGIGVGDSVYSNPLGNFRNIGEPQHHPGDLPYFRGKPTKWAKSNLRICWRIELCLHFSRGCYKQQKMELQRNIMWFFTSKSWHCFVQQKVGVTCNMYQQKMEEQSKKCGSLRNQSTSCLLPKSSKVHSSIQVLGMYRRCCTNKIDMPCVLERNQLQLQDDRHVPQIMMVGDEVFAIFLDTWNASAWMPS